MAPEAKLETRGAAIKKEQIMEEGDEPAAGHEHHHVAPHGGTLVALGEHQAHLEIVVDATQGSLTMYVLDGEAESSIRLKNPAIGVEIVPVGAGTFIMSLAAVANDLSGESAGNSSVFRGSDDRLKAMSSFHMKVSDLAIQGTAYSVAFPFPDGSETDHDHDHAHDH